MHHRYCGAEFIDSGNTLFLPTFLPSKSVTHSLWKLTHLKVCDEHTMQGDKIPAIIDISFRDFLK